MVRKMKMTPEIKGVLRDQRKAFIKKFGREPGPDDPLFFDPEASEPSPLNQKLLEDETRKAMLAAGTPLHFVYAYQKTGFIVNEAGYKSMSPEDRAEYDAAIDDTGTAPELAVGTATEELKDWLVLRASSHPPPVPYVSPLYPDKQTFS